MILDLFSGPRGWSEGLRLLGLSDVGIEHDHAANLTARAAGHAAIEADVAAYPTDPFVGRVQGLIASPPCQAWSMAGKRKGESDRAHCHELADRMATGDDSTTWTEWEDDRSPLVCQPVRWVRDLRPEWVALEEVPAVLGLWEHFGRILRAWGHSVWVGVLNSADYGVPQTRRRAILMASRVWTVQPPEPTHSEHGCDGDLFGGSRKRWVSMAEALGWDKSDRLRHPRGAGMKERHGECRDFNGDEPAMTVTSKARSWERFVVDRRTRSKAAGGRMEPTVPAPTVLFGHRSNDVRWVYERPATTVVTTRRSALGGMVGRSLAEGSVRVSVEEAGVLQSFPADHPWQGSRTKQFEQVGNAVPPLLAAHIIGALVGKEIRETE